MRRRAALPFLFVTVLLDILGLGLIVPIAPQLVVRLGNGPHAIVYCGILTALYGLLQFLTGPLLGSLSDRYGRRPVLLVALGMLGLDYLAFATTPRLWLLFVTRALAGASAGTYTVVNAYIADVTPPEGRTRAYGVLGAAFSIGFLGGPALGGLLGAVSLRLPFVVAAALALVNVGYGALVLPESHARDHRVRVTARQSNPIGAVVRLLRDPVLGTLAGHRLLSDLSRQVWQAVWVLFLAYRFGMDTVTVGLIVAANAVLSGIVQARLSAPCVRWLGDRRTVVLGTSLGALGLLGYALAPAGWMVYPLLLVGAPYAIAPVAAQAWVSRLIDGSQQGRIQGTFTGIGSLTETLVPVPATALFGFGLRVHLPGLPWLAATACLAAAALLVARRPAAAEAPDSDRHTVSV